MLAGLNRLEYSPGASLGLDLGDRHSHLCVLDKQSEAVWNDLVATTKKSLMKLFEQAPGDLAVIRARAADRSVLKLI